MRSFDDTLAAYDFSFPPALIAQAPASPRDSARLLVHDRQSGRTSFATFRDIGDYLPRPGMLVLNRTKVVPARIRLTRATGGVVSVLSLGVSATGHMRALANRRLKTGEKLAMTETQFFTVIGGEEKEWLLQPSFPIAELARVLDDKGEMPLPPYIKKTPLTPEELKREYQSVFARDPGSIAAPTASLHFTEDLLRDLEQSGIRIIYVTLHVHLGTFAPLTEGQWSSGQLHEEEYVINDDARAAIESAKRDRIPVIGVGTTVVRTLESAADASGRIVHPSGTTRLFIREGYRFRIIDGMITNFHVPRSSLLMLVSAFAGRDTILHLYHQAIEQRFRLFSFGDGMLLR